MVNIVEDWDVLEEYVGEKLGYYQIRKSGDKIEIRVATGKLGFKQEFEKPNEELLTRIQDFCRKRRFIQISENIRDETFFK